MKTFKIINLLVGLVVLGMLVFAGKYLHKLMEQDPGHHYKTIHSQQNVNCDLNEGSCMAEWQEKSVTLGFSQPIRYLSKLQTTVTLSGFQHMDIAKVLLDFSMTDMQMGLNRFALQQTQDQDVWQGIVILPVCVSGRKDWQVSLIVQVGQSQYTANYSLQVNN